MVRNIVLTGLTIALLTGCSSKKEENQKTETTDAIPVKVMKLEKRNIAKTLDYTATLQLIFALCIFKNPLGNSDILFLQKIIFRCIFQLILVLPFIHIQLILQQTLVQRRLFQLYFSCRRKFSLNGCIMN